MLVYFRDEDFLGDRTYVCCFVLRLRDRSGGREVAQVIEDGVGQEAESKKGSALNLRNFFFEKLSFLLCNVVTLSCNVATLEVQI